jgi:hypothetical protein
MVDHSVNDLDKDAHAGQRSVETHQRHVTDHSEDGFVYGVLIPFGAVAGFVGGFVVYLMR